jgi:hypothetical protein
VDGIQFNVYYMNLIILMGFDYAPYYSIDSLQFNPKLAGSSGMHVP